MRVYVVTIEEPIFFFPFFAKVFSERRREIVGIGISTNKRRKRTPNYSLKQFIEICLLGFIVYGILNLIKLCLIKAGLFVGVLDKRTHTIGGMARSLSIPVRNVPDVNAKEFVDELRKLEIDILINQAPQKLKSEVLSVPTWGSLNRHSSLLPDYRGSFPIFWGIVNGEKEFGVSIHKMTERYDEGQLLVQKKISRNSMDTVSSLYERTNRLGADALLEALLDIETGSECSLPNDTENSRIYVTPRLFDMLLYFKRKSIGS